MNDHDVVMREERDEKIRRLASRLGVFPCEPAGAMVAFGTSKAGEFFALEDIIDALLDRLDEAT